MVLYVIAQNVTEEADARNAGGMMNRLIEHQHVLYFAVRLADMIKYIAT